MLRLNKTWVERHKRGARIFTNRTTANATTPPIIRSPTWTTLHTAASTRLAMQLSINHARNAEASKVTKWARSKRK